MKCLTKQINRSGRGSREGQQGGALTTHLAYSTHRYISRHTDETGITIYNSQSSSLNDTFCTFSGHLKARDRQKSLSDTCDSNISASAQSKRPNVNASRGWCGVAGHNSALANVIGRASQAQHVKLTECSMQP